MSFFKELKRRNVLKVAAAYIITSWLVAQVAELAVDSFGAPDWVMKILITLLALGLPFAIIFSWAFEMTPEGLKKEKDIDRKKSITQQTGRKLDFTIIAILVVALGYFVADKFRLNPVASQPAALATAPDEQQSGPQSIAVLPFVDMSEAGDNEYFSDGLTEELLNILAKIKELHVAGRTSSFAFKGKDEDLRSIGEKLNVSTILEGSVRKDNKRNRVRITAQLINVDDGYHLWSETYDRDLDDIFAIQEEIARKVAQALRITLLGEDEEKLEHLANTQMNAYDLYLQALKSINENSFDSLKRAAEEFQQAVALDPMYTPAQLGLVSTWQAQATTGSITGQQATDNSLPLLSLILQREPGNSDAHSLMASVYEQQRNYPAAEQEHQAALKANPRNAAALVEAGDFLFAQDRVSEGMQFFHQAAAIEPYSIRVQWQLCAAQSNLINQQQAALAACERIREIEPDSPNGYYGPTFVYKQNGDLAKSVYWDTQAVAFDENDYELPARVAGFWTNLGDLDRAEHWIQQSLALGEDQPQPVANKILLLQQQEQYALATQLARQAIRKEDRNGSRVFIRNAFVIDVLNRKEFQAALDAYHVDNPEIFEEPMRLRQDRSARDMDALIEIAFILKSADITAHKAVELLDFVATKLQTANPLFLPWHTELSMAALENVRGNKDAAITLLNSAYEHNMRDEWRFSLQHWFVFESLHNEPEYQQLVARFEADMERQREQAYLLLGIKK